MVKWFTFLIGTDRIGALIRKYKEISRFLREFPNGFLGMDNIQNKKFIEFLVTVGAQLNNIDLFIDSARALERLKVGTIKIGDNSGYSATNGLNSYIFFDNEGNITDIRKIYSDLDEKLYYSELEPTSLTITEEYRVWFDGNPNWILVVENNAVSQWRYACIKDFGFDTSKLPSEEELSNYKEPLTLKKFKKENPERKTYELPF